jgi:microcystin-dependent protein
MPSANGVYSLPPGYLATTGSTIVVSEHNPIFEDVAAALTGRLSRDGTAAMTGPIQLASGTVSAPGAVFSTDGSTGLYSLGAGAGVGVAVGGVQVAAFLPGGVLGARELGELVAYTCTAAPSALWQLPFGQTLSRTTYALLWAQAQIEIAAGSTLYNNGDGSTTFGVPDMRGRLPIGWDTMGGTASGRLTTAGAGVDGTTLGSAGGAQNVLPVQANLPNVAPTATFAGITQTWGSNQGNVDSGIGNATGPATGGAGVGTEGQITTTVTPSGNITVQSLNGNVTQTPINKLPPVIITNYILFVGGTL